MGGSEFSVNVSVPLNQFEKLHVVKFCLAYLLSSPAITFNHQGQEWQGHFVVHQLLLKTSIKLFLMSGHVRGKYFIIMIFLRNYKNRVMLKENIEVFFANKYP